MKRKQLLICLLFTALFPLRNAFSQDFGWARNMGGTGSGYGRAVATDAAGNVYTAGFFSGTADFDPGTGTVNLSSAGANDAFIHKMDAAGNFIWARNIGGTANDYAYTIAVDNSGNVYAAGRFDGTVDFNPGTGTNTLTTAGGADMYVLKLDAAGNYLWARAMGGTTTDQINRIALDAAGNVYATGVFNGAADFDPGAATFTLTPAGAEEAFVMRLNANGDFAWAHPIGSTGNDRGYSITVDNADNVLTTGVFSGTVDFDPGAGTLNLTSAGNFDFFVQKLSSAGSLIWASNAGGTSLDFGWDITTDAANNVYTTGYFQGTSDLDPGTGVSTLTSAGNYDIFVQKLTAAGSFEWARSMGGPTDDRGYAVAVDAFGSVYLSGYYIGSADFDPGVATHTLTAAGNADFYVLKLNSLGDFTWVRSMGGANHDFGLDMAIDNAGSMYTAGNFEGAADFNPDPVAVATLTPFGASDVFVAKLTQCFPSTGSITATACTTYTSPSGTQTWTSSGIYTDVVPNAGGCDSTITVNLTINSATSSSITATACNSYTSPSGNSTWTTSGTYTDLLQNAAGCDSVITVQLTINSSTSSTLIVSDCGSYTSPSGTQTWTASGIYTDVLPNSAGCDSTITITLTINQPITTTPTVNICQGDSILIAGVYQTTAGVYTDIFSTIAGCDSVVNTTLTVNQVNNAVTQNGSTFTAAQAGATYQWLNCDAGMQPIAGETGQSFTAQNSGNYAVSVTQNGCTVTSGCVSVVIIGIAESTALAQVSVYPNPAIAQVTVAFGQEQQHVQAIVFTAEGKQVHAQQFRQVESAEINLKGIPAGIYFLQLKTETGVTSKKLVIINGR